MSQSHHPPNTLFSLYPPISSLTFDIRHPADFLEACHPLTCPYDSTPQLRQCARLMDGSRRHMKAASTMAITVKAMAPIKKSSLQSGCKTSRNFPHDDQPPATQTRLQERDTMPRLLCPLTFHPRRIRRSRSGLAPHSF